MGVGFKRLYMWQCIQIIMHITFYLCCTCALHGDNNVGVNSTVETACGNTKSDDVVAVGRLDVRVSDCAGELG